MGHRTVIVVAGGERAADSASRVVSVTSGTLVIAADSGVDVAHGLGLRVDVAVGDFDSVSDEGLERAERNGARVIRHPAAKDHTDLELALAEARALDPVEIVVLGAGGGRLDHFLANVLALAAPELAPCHVTAHVGPATVRVARGGEPAVDVGAAPGALVTLLAVGGPAKGVRTTGMQYPLRSEVLFDSSTRGVSNVVESVPATVEIESGTLLIVVPGEEGAHDA